MAQGQPGSTDPRPKMRPCDIPSPHCVAPRCPLSPVLSATVLALLGFLQMPSGCGSQGCCAFILEVGGHSLGRGDGLISLPVGAKPISAASCKREFHCSPCTHSALIRPLMTSGHKCISECPGDGKLTTCANPSGHVPKAARLRQTQLW